MTTDDVILEAKRDALREARVVISQYLATAEKWRYDRVMWAFAVMLGEVAEDSPEPGPEDAVLLAALRRTELSVKCTCPPSTASGLLLSCVVHDGLT